MTRLTLKKIKTFIGHEGYGLNAELFLDGVKVAFILDDANGGDVDYQFTDKASEDRVWAFVKSTPDDEYTKGMRTQEYWMKYPKAIETHKLDTLINEFVDNFQQEKRLNRLRKNNVVFTTPDCKEGQFYQLKHNGFIDKAKENVLTKHPNAVFM